MVFFESNFVISLSIFFFFVISSIWPQSKERHDPSLGIPLFLFYPELYIMNFLIRKFKVHLLVHNYPPRLRERYLRSVRLFLFRYHANTEQLTAEHFERFYDFLRRKQYHSKQIDEYINSLRIFSSLLNKNIQSDCFDLRKKLHRNDEVSLCSRCTKSNKKR
jgi:hypothetical protein